MFRQFQAGRYELTQMGRCKELAVLCLLLCLTVCMVILVVRPIQAMEAAIAGIGIVDILRTDGAGVTTVTVSGTGLFHSVFFVYPGG